MVCRMRKLRKPSQMASEHFFGRWFWRDREVKPLSHVTFWFDREEEEWHGKRWWQWRISAGGRKA